MTSQNLKKLFTEQCLNLPYPIAVYLKQYIDTDFFDERHEWEILSRDIFVSTVKFLTHVHIADLAAIGKNPRNLYHRILTVLSSPPIGRYVEFLRETARYYCDNNIESGIPRMIDFIIRADVACTILPTGKGFLDELLSYRNMLAHGRTSSDEILSKNLAAVRDLTAKLIEEISFLSEYTLCFDDGRPVMGPSPDALKTADSQGLVIMEANIPLRPLLIKLKNNNIVLLEDNDLAKRKLIYKGFKSYVKLTPKELNSSQYSTIIEELKRIIDGFRSIDDILPRPGWDSFRERSEHITEETITSYNQDTRVYLPELYIESASLFDTKGLIPRFFDSDKKLLVLNGIQGAGKSAFAAHLADSLMKKPSAQKAVFFLNGQRLSYAEVFWSRNPYPDYFSHRLNYECLMDTRAFKHVFKQAPKDAQVVFIIDAIDEVDGLTNKWNKFRAMEFFLEWAATITSPHVKIIITFDITDYQTFEFLRPGELPANLDEICFTEGQSHDYAHWVIDLPPFGVDTAHDLFKRIIRNDIRTMKPEFTWEYCCEQAGADLEDMVSTPQRFKIFLKSHAGLNAISTTKREKLFEFYADRFTGVEGQKNWSLWKKMLGMFRNGNMTQGEELIALLTSKMASQGGTALLESSLCSSKLDKRIRAYVEGSNNGPYDRLKTGGLISEELFTHIENNEEHTEKRISFARELIVEVAEGIQKKERLKEIIDYWRNFFLLNILIVISLVIIGRVEVIGLAKKHGIPETLFYTLLYYTFLAVFQVYTPIIIFLLSINFMLSPTISIKHFGFFEISLRQYLLKQNNKNIFLSFYPILIFFFMLMILIRSLEYLIMDFSDITSQLFFLMQFILLIIFAAYLLRTRTLYSMIEESINPRYAKRMSRVITEFVSSQSYKSVKNNKRQIVHSIVLFITLYAGYFYFIDQQYGVSDMVFSQPSNTVSEMYLSALNKGLSPNVVDNAVLFFSALVIAAIIFIYYTEKIWYSVREKKFYELLSLPRKNIFTLRRFLGMYFFVVLISFLIIMPVWYFNDFVTYLKSPEKQIEKTFGVSVYDGQLHLSVMQLTQEQINILYNTKNSLPFTELFMPFVWDYEFDLSQMNDDINILHVKAKALKGINEYNIKYKDDLSHRLGLYLYDPDDADWWPPGSSDISFSHVNVLGLSGGCSSLGDIYKMFPDIETLVISEDVARTLSEDLAQLSIRRLAIDCDGPPVLDWLCSGHKIPDYSLSSPPDVNTQNISLLRGELEINFSYEFDLNVLASADSLTCLYLSTEKNISVDWFISLKNLIENNLSSLEKLIIYSFNKDDKLAAIKATAMGRENMLGLLDHLIEGNTYVGIFEKKMY